MIFSFFLKGTARFDILVYFNLGFAFGLVPSAPFIGEGHFVFVVGVVHSKCQMQH